MAKIICAHCGKEVTGNVFRRYCSNACKQAAYRERKVRKEQAETKNKPVTDVGRNEN